MDLKYFGHTIRERRRALGLSLSDLEKKTGVSRSTIKKYEDGNTEPGMIKTFAIMRGLGLGMEFLENSITRDESDPLPPTVFEKVENLEAKTLEKLISIEKKIARLGENKRRLALC